VQCKSARRAARRACMSLFARTPSAGITGGATARPPRAAGRASFQFSLCSYIILYFYLMKIVWLVCSCTFVFFSSGRACTSCKSLQWRACSCTHALPYPIELTAGWCVCVCISGDRSIRRSTTMETGEKKDQRPHHLCRRLPKARFGRAMSLGGELN